jgi:AcrR family transcriptional regulator
MPWGPFRAGTIAVAPKTRPRTKPAEARREDLMNAAQARFLELGVGPTTIDQIAAGADVAKGTFYLHFASKEAVLTALRARYVREFQARLQLATEKCPLGDWTGKLAAWAAWAAAGVTAYLESVPLHDIVREHLTSLLAGGVAEQAWSVEDPRFTAVFLFHGLHGTVDEAKVDARPVKKPQLIRKLQRACFRVVGVSDSLEGR